MYFAYTWVADYSFLYAYLVNLALIILALASDEYAFKIYYSALQSKKNIKELKFSSFVRFHLDAYISFKAILYLFYISIMVLSQVVTAYPALVNENLGNFIAANEYSILLLIALDLFNGQFTRDKERTKKLSEEIEKAFTEAQAD